MYIFSLLFVGFTSYDNLNDAPMLGVGGETSYRIILPTPLDLQR